MEVYYVITKSKKHQKAENRELQEWQQVEERDEARTVSVRWGREQDGAGEQESKEWGRRELP